MAMGGGVAVAGDVPDDVVIETIATAPVVASSDAVAEALSALQHLGYGPGDAAGAVAEASSSDPEVGTAELIRAALKLLAPKGKA
jgi:Holliday junction DNA helicase RuvA